MKFRTVSFTFFTAAALAFTPTAFAADTLTEEICYDLSGSADRTIAEGTQLVVQTEIDGTFSGTLDGAGYLDKRGSANLTLDGAVELGSGKISVTEGTLTLGQNVTIPNTEYYISNTANLVISKNSDFSSSLVVTDTNKAGTISSTGVGNVSVSQLSGNILNVNAGTLTVRNSASFNEICVLSGAKFQIGDGTAGSLASVSGNISVEKNASVVFNRKADSTTSTYNGTISGDGNVAFNGTQIFYFTKGKNQTYTGTTTINAGGMVFQRATLEYNGQHYYNPNAAAATLASPTINVNSQGTFGGHVTTQGNVNVGGTSFTSFSDWESKFGKGSWGAWSYGAGVLFADAGDVLTINGDLTIEETQLELYFPTETSFDYSGNSGGAMRVHFGSVGSGKIVANGNVELGGSLILAGANGIAPGQVSVFFESAPNKTTGTFDQIVYGSDNVTLLLPGVGGIKEGQYGIATTENRNVRKRSSFDEHEGLSQFVDYLVSQANGTNKVAQAVSLAGANSVTSVVNNFSALSYSAFAEMAIRQSDAELDMILQNVTRAYLNRPTSEDGVRVPANFTTFSGITTDFVDHESENDLPVYDFDSLGVYTGCYTWIDDERIIGGSVSVHRSSAKPHGNGGTLDDAAARAKLFAVFTPKFSDWSLTVGGTFGGHYYEIDRETALGKNYGDTDGVDAGFFASINLRREIQPGLIFTPYMRFEYNFSYVGGLSESGSAGRLQLQHIISNNYSLRFGSGLEYTPTKGKTFGLDFGFIGTFGERPSITSEFIEYADSRTTIKGTNGERMVFELAPRFNLDLGNNWEADAAVRLQCSFEGSFNHSFGIGLSKHF